MVGQRFVLRDFQKEVIRGIYDSPTTLGIISFPKKNGKTGLAAPLLLVHLCGPMARRNSQLFSTAQSREQAAVVFTYAANIVRFSPELSAYVAIRDTKKELFCPELGTLYKALSKESKTAHGKSPAFVIHDELGQVSGPRSKLYSAMETAPGAHTQPLALIISTQAEHDGDLLSIKIDDAKTGADPTIKLFLWTADESLDPFSDEALRQANPALDDFLNYNVVRKLAENARRMPSDENEYRNKNLNQRVTHSNPVFSRQVWEEGNRPVKREIFFDGRPVYGGLDLSGRNALTAAVFVAQDDKSNWHSLPIFWAPRLELEERSKRDRVPYDVWAKQGFLSLTKGKTVDYDTVAESIVEFCSRANVVAIRFDRWRMDVFLAALKRVDGVPDVVVLKGSAKRPADIVEGTIVLEEHGQGFRDMTPAVEAMTEIVGDAQFVHGGHPIMRDHAHNAVLLTDQGGGKKLDQSSQTARIDGIVSAAMALYRATADIVEDNSSVLDFLRSPVIA